jgi:hypothetical protein
VCAYTNIDIYQQNDTFPAIFIDFVGQNMKKPVPLQRLKKKDGE